MEKTGVYRFSRVSRKERIDILHRLVLKRGCKKWRYFRDRTKPGSEIRRTLPINIMDNRPAHQLSRKKRNKKTTSLGATRKPSAICKFKILH